MSAFFYVYEHWRLDTDTCFYVGKGTKNRAYSRYRRNAHWKNIVDKLERIGSGYEVRLVATGLSEDDAFSLEVERIAFWRDRVDLANITKGGDSGPVMIGEEHPMHGRKRPDLAERNRNRIWTDEARENAAKKATGVIVSEETRLKMRLSRLGRPSPNKGKKNLGVSAANKARAGTEAASLAAGKAFAARLAKLNSVKDLTE